MVFKLIEAANAKPGTSILVDGVPYTVKSNEISKTGKHGHSKCRIEAISILDGKKKVFIIGGHERLECPSIIKKKGQILSISNNIASVMDLESFETLEIPLGELKEVSEGDQIEYWDVEGNKLIKRKL